MSRDIKFRIYDTDEKEMFYQEDIDYIDINNEIAYINQDGGGYDYLIDFVYGDGKLMQCTGSKDIKGIEVYEGDIIPFHLDSNVKGVVKFGEYTDWNCKRPTQHIGFYVDFTGEHKRINRKDLGYWVEVSYVIGNIYDNPELLEGEE
ncbi:hypothetical protein CYK67_14385 [Clostridium perfringens]|nr:hypothetical protein CYK68_14515 [Clostridium perfringens]PWX10463.1 hypothetical protein CYK67_14385 [Clostridium perfringens]PWX14732.1 hypothetical protein CYK66_14900 [Clostridium perfringens]